MSNPWYQVRNFEQLLCEYTNSPYCVVVDSCTNSLFLCLMYLKEHNLIDKREIEIPEKTYISVPMQIKNAGFIPKFKNKKWYGYYYLKDTNIIDSATMFEKNMYIKGSLQCLSFQYKKHLPIGKGGAILTDNKNAYEWLLRARHDGRNMYDNFGDVEDVKNIGWHFPLLPSEACIGIELLYNKNLTEKNKKGSYKDYKKIDKNIF